MVPPFTVADNCPLLVPPHDVSNASTETAIVGSIVLSSMVKVITSDEQLVEVLVIVR